MPQDGKRLRDFFRSLKLYFIFIRYSATGFVSFVIDVGVFAFFYYLTHHQFFSLLVGRLVSGSFNFYFNKYLVYRSLDRDIIKREAFYYSLLATFIFFLSYTVINELTAHLSIHILLAKIVVDIVLFFGNFLIQRHLFGSRRVALQQALE